MASVATPPPVTPAVTPAPAPVAAPAPDKTGGFGPEDHYTARIAAKLGAAISAQPVEPTAPAAPVIPSGTPEQAHPPAPVPAPAPVTEAKSAEVDLDDIDFDAPVEAPVPVTEEPTKIPDAQVSSTLEQMLANGDVPDKIEEMFLKHSRGKQMLESYKTLRELRKSPEEGGIGHIPTLDEIRSATESHRQMQAMQFEADANPVSFASNLFTINPETGKAAIVGGPAQVQAILSSIPEVLSQAIQSSPTPELRQQHAALMAAYSAPVFNRFLGHQYASALAMPESTDQEKSDKGRVLDALQIVEYKLYGAARPLQLGTSPANPNAPDPEKQQLQERLRQYEQTFRNTQTMQMQGVERQVDGVAREAALKDIGVLFSKAGVGQVYKESILAPHRAQLYSDIMAILPQHDPTGWQTYELQVEQAKRGQVDAKVPAETRRRLFQNALRTLPQVKQTVSDLVQGAQSLSTAQHATLTEAQQRVQSNGAGSPAPQSVVPAVQQARQPGESNEEFYARRIASKMIVPAR